MNTTTDASEKSSVGTPPICTLLCLLFTPSALCVGLDLKESIFTLRELVMHELYAFRSRA